MSIVIRHAGAKTPTFAPKSVVVSADGQRIYLVIGPGQASHQFEGIRLSGAVFKHGKAFIRDGMNAFEGEVVLKND